MVARELLKRYNTCFLSVADEDFSPDAMEECCEVLAVDDLHLMEDSGDKETLCELIRTERERHFVLLTWGAIPGWLMPFQFAGVMESFGLEDLLLDKAAAKVPHDTHGASLYRYGTGRDAQRYQGLPGSRWPFCAYCLNRAVTAKRL